MGLQNQAGRMSDAARRTSALADTRAAAEAPL